MLNLLASFDIFAKCVGYASISLFGLGCVMVACAERNRKKEERTAPLRSADAPPQGDAPHLPPQLIVHLNVGDREAGRAKHDKDFQEQRARWAAKMEVERLIADIEEGL